MHEEGKDFLLDKDGNIMKEPVKCALCGEHWDKTLWAHIERPHGTKDPDECFSCWHWREHYEADQTKDKEIFVVVDGHHYLIGDEDTKLLYRGFGGCRFVIRFHGGRTITSTNLWHQGKIPEYWRSLLPDNAIFMDA